MNNSVLMSTNPTNQRPPQGFATMHSVLLIALGSTLLMGVLSYFKQELMGSIQDRVSVCLTGEASDWTNEPKTRSSGISVEPRAQLTRSETRLGDAANSVADTTKPGMSPRLQPLTDEELRDLRMTGPDDIEKLKALKVPGTDLLTLAEVAAKEAVKRGDIVRGIARNVHEPLSKANIVLGAYNGMIDAYRFQRDPNLDTSTDLVSSGVGLAGSVAGSPHLMVASAGFNIGKAAGGAIMGTDAVGVFFLTKLGFSETIARDALEMTRSR